MGKIRLMKLVRGTKDYKKLCRLLERAEELDVDLLQFAVDRHVNQSQLSRQYVRDAEERSRQLIVTLTRAVEEYSERKGKGWV